MTFAFERVEVFVFLNRSEYLFDNTALCLIAQRNKVIVSGIQCPFKKSAESLQF